MKTQCLSHPLFPPKCLWQLLCLGSIQLSWQKTETHTHLPAWAQSTQSSLQRTLLLETSNFTDHGLGGKMSPQKQVGNYSLLESWKHQDRWVRPQTGFLASSPKELENPAPSSSQPGVWWCRLGRWQRLTTGIFLTSKRFSCCFLCLALLPHSPWIPPSYPSA